MSPSWEGCGSVERRKQHMHKLTVGLRKNGWFDSAYNSNCLLIHVNLSLQQYWSYSPVWFHVVWICRMVLTVTFAYNTIILPCQSNLSCEEQLLMFFGCMLPILRYLNFVYIITVCVCLCLGRSQSYCHACEQLDGLQLHQQTADTSQ